MSFPRTKSSKAFEFILNNFQADWMILTHLLKFPRRPSNKLYDQRVEYQHKFLPSLSLPHSRPLYFSAWLSARALTNSSAGKRVVISYPPTRAWKIEKLGAKIALGEIFRLLDESRGEKGGDLGAHAHTVQRKRREATYNTKIEDSAGVGISIYGVEGHKESSVEVSPSEHLFDHRKY